MADIFISYSSYDREHAQKLTEVLGSAGLSVWIDSSGIEAATNWSESIVDAIDSCSAVVVMLSPNSVQSPHVAKEVSLASERRKKILPLDLEPVDLPKSLQYHLAGIQRTSMTNIDGILRALGGIGVEATATPSNKLVFEAGFRKSLMILPFEDLSPTHDSEWFADGLAAELITSLSHVKALRVTDQQTTKEFKHYAGHLSAYAMEMNIRYFIQGSVRKFGDQIKITTALLDIETGDQLWADSMKGTMDDIFDIQEKVAANVVEGLKVHLATDEKKKLFERDTDNADAYELYLKAQEYGRRQTKEGFQLAVQLFSEAIKLDPAYAAAYAGKASYLTSLYGGYVRDQALLDEGLHLITESLRLKPDLWRSYFPLSQILRLQGKLEEAERTATECIRNAPDDFMGYFALGHYYFGTNQPDKAIPAFEQAVQFHPENLPTLWNLVVCCNAAKSWEKRLHWSGVAIPIYEKHLKLYPDHETNRVNHAVLLHFAGRDDDAREAARELENLRDGAALHNTANLICELGDYDAGLRTFRKAVEAGYRNIRLMKEFLNSEVEGIAKLKGTPEYEEARLLVESIEQEHEANTNR